MTYWYVVFSVSPTTVFSNFPDKIRINSLVVQLDSDFFRINVIKDYICEKVAGEVTIINWQQLNENQFLEYKN
jgi:hypothetical protein